MCYNKKGDNMKKINIGDIVNAEITGIQPYGIFVKVNNEYTGLIHISEVSDDYVKNISSIFNIKEIVRAKVIDIDPETAQLRLSYKVLQNNKRTSYRTMKYHKWFKANTGFESIKEQLPIWIRKAKEEMNNDKN